MQSEFSNSEMGSEECELKYLLSEAQKVFIQKYFKNWVMIWRTW